MAWSPSPSMRGKQPNFSSAGKWFIPWYSETNNEFTKNSNGSGQIIKNITNLDFPEIAGDLPFFNATLWGVQSVGSWGHQNGWNMPIAGQSWQLHTLPETNMEHLKMGAPWNLGDSYWKPSFPGSMLIFGGVPSLKLTANTHPKRKVVFQPSIFQVRKY